MHFTVLNIISKLSESYLFRTTAVSVVRKGVKQREKKRRKREKRKKKKGEKKKTKGKKWSHSNLALPIAHLGPSHHSHVLLDKR